MKQILLRAVPSILAAALILSGCPQNGDPSGAMEAPQAPEKPSATSGDRHLVVSWGAVDQATAYEVWYAQSPESGEAEVAGRQRYGETISPLSLVIAGLKNGTFYHVWVKAKNEEGVSEFSESVKESPSAPAALTAPPIPEILEPEGGARSITVKWTKVDGATGYDVYYLGSAALSETAAVEGGDSQSREISGLEDDTTYYVWVSARNDAGSSGNSEVKTCTTYKGEKAVLSFSIGDQGGIIDESAKTIDLLSIPYNTNLAALSVTLTISPGATVNPASGTSVDFSSGQVTFTVTAQNGDTQEYTARVTKKGRAAATLHWTAGEGFSDPAGGALILQSPLVLDSENDSADIAIKGSFASYEWYVDNVLKGSGGGTTEVEVTLQLAVEDYLPGGHRLDLIVRDDTGVPYSTGLDFTVDVDAE